MSRRGATSLGDVHIESTTTRACERRGDSRTGRAGEEHGDGERRSNRSEAHQRPRGDPCEPPQRCTAPRHTSREGAPRDRVSRVARCARRRDLEGAGRHDQRGARVRGARGWRIRVSRTYEAPDHGGKTSAHIDTHHGRCVKLVPGEQVVEAMSFETPDPAMQGEMTTSDYAGARRERRRTIVATVAPPWCESAMRRG